MKTTRNLCEISCAKRSALIFLALFASAILSGCSTLNLESAKELATAGQETSASAKTSIFVTDDEFQRAMDAEAFFHGVARSDVPKELSVQYDAVKKEFASRKQIFEMLGELYAEFGKLASVDATGMETAINNFGTAVNEYAASQNREAVVSKTSLAAFSKIGAMLTKEMQKEEVKKASELIRTRLEAFNVLFSDPLVKTQLMSFKEALAANRSSVMLLLWKKGVYDPTPLLNEMGSDSGLIASKDAGKIVQSDAMVAGGLNGAISSRIERKMRMAESSYVASVKSISLLIEKHNKLEKGEEINIGTLKQQLSELQAITAALMPSNSTNGNKRSGERYDN